ncbi:hypothetical protein BGW80DRAFT_1353756 [Lactifluus volemus]|nr:hypothetical protein BGW80DRAFT_1353756 [Lactifluus volemus]
MRHPCPPQEPKTPVMAEVSFSDSFAHLHRRGTPVDAPIFHRLERSALDSPHRRPRI